MIVKRLKLPWFSLGMLTILILAAIFAPHISSHDPLEQDILNRLTPPGWLNDGSWEYLLGTDSLGRDVFSNALYGLRVSILVGLVAVTISVIIGVFGGLIAGYQPGSRLELFIMRAVDIQLSLPTIMIALGAMAIFGQGLWKLILIIGVVGWAQYARIARGSVLEETSKTYVKAARTIGCSQPRILFRHILPNILNPILVQISVDIPRVVELAATLSFLGLGVSVTTPSLGLRISQEYQYLLSGQWWSTIIPGITLVLLVLSANLVADWTRDKLDPRHDRLR
jgi:peptide/nickel transport system permease protein